MKIKVYQLNGANFINKKDAVERLKEMYYDIEKGLELLNKRGIHTYIILTSLKINKHTQSFCVRDLYHPIVFENKFEIIEKIIEVIE